MTICCQISDSISELARRQNETIVYLFTSCYCIFSFSFPSHSSSSSQSSQSLSSSSSIAFCFVYILVAVIFFVFAFYFHFLCNFIYFQVAAVGVLHFTHVSISLTPSLRSPFSLSLCLSFSLYWFILYLSFSLLCISQIELTPKTRRCPSSRPANVSTCRTFEIPRDFYAVIEYISLSKHFNNF